MGIMKVYAKPLWLWHDLVDKSRRCDNEEEVCSCGPSYAQLNEYSTAYVL
jgi:hypothetical protein